jgi:RNA polymerase sigma factor (sigma-70 family)
MSDSSIQTTQLVHWLQRIRGGDSTAREELMRAVWVRVEQLTHKMLRSFPNVRRWADTNDVLQGTLVRLLRSLEAVQLDDKRAFFALVATHIRREMIDLARHYAGLERRGILACGPAPSENLAALAEAPAASEETGELDTWAAFHEAVEKLPAEEREVVGLIFYHGWTQPQVAELFQVSDRTIRRHWQSASLRLHKALAGRLPAIED